jgi:anti-anti-sigma factor
MSTAPPVLKVDVEHVDEACVIRTQGELDIATAPMLESVLLHAMDSGAASIVLDLGRVSFIDSMGLRVLVCAGKESRENGDRLRIDCGTGPVRRMMELTSLDRSLPLTAGGRSPAPVPG